jgi:hypothetical protein
MIRAWITVRGWILTRWLAFHGWLDDLDDVFERDL